MGCDMEPTAPQMPLCENCSAPAQLQCGHCKELFFCDKPACFEALHPRPRDREMHLASATSYGASSNCALHPEFKLHLVCEDPACGDAMICVRCERREHAGHNTIEISEYVARQCCILRSHAADLTKQRAAADEKCCVLEAVEPPEARYKDLLLQTHVGHLLMGEDVWRSNVVCEEVLTRSFLTQALSAAGQVCALKTFVAKAEHMIDECEQVCLLGDDQALRAATESQAVVRNIDSMAACRDRHRLVGAAYPHAEFSLTLPVSDVHDALGQRLGLVVPVLVEGVDGVEHLIEVSVDDTVCDLRRKVASATKLPGNSFGMCIRGEVVGEGEDMTQLSADRILLKLQAKEQVAIAALDALGERNLTAARLAEVTDAKVACLLLQAGVATAIPNKFFSGAAFVRLDLSAVSGIASIGEGFLQDCTSLEVLDISGLTSVTSVGTYFLHGCKALKELDLTPLSNITAIKEAFLGWCTSLKQLDLSPFVRVTAIDDYFLQSCTALEELNLSGLLNVRVINNQFLFQCSSLTELDLSPLSRVTVIQDWFLYECTSLTQLDLSPFSGVTSVGACFLAFCRSLKELDLTPLSNITAIKGSFLFGCTSLTQLDLSPFSGVTSVDTHFLALCKSLKELDLTPLCNITAIEKSFLYKCTSLKQLDLSPFVRVTAIDSCFLEKCTALEELNLSGLLNVSVIEDQFLDDCSSLKQLDLSPLSNVLEVGKDFLRGCSPTICGKKKCSKAVLAKLQFKVPFWGLPKHGLEKYFFKK